MNTAPAFAGSAVNSHSGKVPATLDTSLTTPTNTVVLITGATNGTKIDTIRTAGILTTVAGVMNIFVKRSSVYYLFDQVLVNVVTVSTTAVSFKDVRYYTDLYLNSGDTLEAAVTIAGLQSALSVTASGGDY